jgi:hypothetical protein
MYFENVQLPSPVIAELYKQSLVVLQDFKPITTNGIADADTNASPVAIAGGSEIAFKYLGGYEKQITILVAEHFNPHIGEEDLEFLSKMLAACKLSLSDVAIINVVTNPQSNQLWQQMPPKVMLMFDVDPGTVGLPFRRPHFEVQEWSGAVFMNAPELSTFRTGNDADVKMLKTKLWLCLQKIFLSK